jgi:hypothetical protein
MASLLPGDAVSLTPSGRAALTLRPSTPELYVALHADALKAPASRHTQVVGLLDDDVVWLGALGEDLLARRAAAPRADARALVGRCLMAGTRLWEIVLPGPLVSPGLPEPLSTVYAGERPWLVIGEASGPVPIAVPLNDPSNPKWFAPVIRREQMSLGAAKDSQVELAHAWTVRPSASTIGYLRPAAVADVGSAIASYYGIA